MDLHEAIEWLEHRGGSWSVRATSAACMVMVAVGSNRLGVPAQRLNREQVATALVGAVEQLRSRIQQQTASALDAEGAAL